MNKITVLLARTSPAGVNSPPMTRTCPGDNKQTEHEGRQQYSGPHRERTSAFTAATNNTYTTVCNSVGALPFPLFVHFEKLDNPAYYAYNTTNVYMILCV